MTQSPPPPGPARADQVVEVKHDPARDTDLPPPQSAEQVESNKQAHMAAAGLAALTAAQILKREEEASSATLAASTHAFSQTTGASLPATLFAWAFLLAVGLGSIAGMIAIIIAMLR